MEVLGNIAAALTSAVAMFATVVPVRSMPDTRRHLEIRSM
ncbi:DUF6893 family small protein [Couchioplanes caeruleus]|uniref:Uncharacterized protein n=1 Tax=Couchioplanes caeruleus TaxID=56438 RepID=A0A3N1GU54_9ACTN|nr:hypothetical protein EDD30_6770 [Couchioplanes caeruleus]